MTTKAEFEVDTITHSPPPEFVPLDFPVFAKSADAPVIPQGRNLSEVIRDRIRNHSSQPRFQ